MSQSDDQCSIRTGRLALDPLPAGLARTLEVLGGIVLGVLTATMALFIHALFLFQSASGK